MKSTPVRSIAVTRTLAVAAVATLTLAAACGGSGFTDPEAPQSQQSGPAELQLLYAGDAIGVSAVKQVTDAWATSSGNKITVSAATDMTQELSQGFASGNPPDVFTVNATTFAQYAKAGNLAPYAQNLPMADDFTPSLRQSFTYDGTFYCAPKDTSTLALIINTELWEAAGLTEADVPTTWEQLATVAKTLTKGKVTGLVIGDTRDRIGAFMKQSGGWITDAEQTAMTADTPENLAALNYLRTLLEDGTAKYPKQVGAGWGGEAFGKATAAMTIEGNWIKGPLATEFPKIKYQVVELPAGPVGKGTLAFTECWGIAAKSPHQAQAQQLVEQLLSTDNQLKLADELGLMPSLVSALPTYAEQHPEDKGFVDGLAYAQGPVSAPGMDPVLKDFDTQLQGLPKADPQKILASLQRNGQAALGG